MHKHAYATVFGKINHFRASTEIHFLLVPERYVHALPRDTMSAFSDGFWLMLLSHKDVFLGPEGP